MSQLNQAQLFSLLFEVTSTANLLRDGEQLIRGMRDVDSGVDSALAVTSIGVEKLLKLNIGLAATAHGQGWPSGSTMRCWGHNIGPMDAEVRRILRQHAGAATSRRWLIELLDDVESDDLWPLLVTSLHRYATAGRFHHLDHLALGSSEPDDDPRKLWDQLEVNASKRVPAISDGTAYGDNDRIDAAVLELRGNIAASIHRWLSMIVAFWTHGVLGAQAKSLGPALVPSGERF